MQSCYFAENLRDQAICTANDPMDDNHGDSSVKAKSKTGHSNGPPRPSDTNLAVCGETIKTVFCSTD